MIPHIEPSFYGREAEAVSDLIDSGSWLTEFVKTRELEDKIANYVGSTYCHMYPNCTLALYAALQAFGIRQGDEVIVPDLTMIASATAVSMTGAKPVFVDVDPTTLCISDRTAERAITNRTRAIMVVDLNGRSPNNYGELYWLAQRWGLALIEDAAQAFGSRNKCGEFLGTQGDIGCFSFSPHKIITTGQGGCCVTNHSTYDKYLSQYRNFGRSESGGFEHETIGINLKFTDLQAVIGLEQLKSLDWRIKRKKEIFKMYRSLLREYVHFLPTGLDYVTPWYMDIYTNKRDSLQRFLSARGIGTQKMYPTISTTRAYYDSKLYNTISMAASTEGLFLPSSITLTDDTIEYMCDMIVDFMKGKF